MHQQNSQKDIFNSGLPLFAAPFKPGFLDKLEKSFLFVLSLHIITQQLKHIESVQRMVKFFIATNFPIHFLLSGFGFLDLPRCLLC